MPETSALKWTALRHRLLREVAGRTQIVTNWPAGPGPTWRDGVPATAYETRSLRALCRSALLRYLPGAVRDEARFGLTDTGAVLLAEWDRLHPEAGGPDA